MGVAPKVLAVNLDGIPAALRAPPQWVCWRLETRGNDPKPTKVPYRADGRGRASSTDPKTWTTFGAAHNAYLKGGYDGIGYVLHRAEGEDGPTLAAIDLDDCRNPETGELEPWAAEIVAELASYTEVSPSGSGIRILVWARLPAGKRKNGRVELYDDKRYVTVTGHHVEGTPATIEHRQEQLDAVYARVFGRSAASKAETNGHCAAPPYDTVDGRPDVILRAVAWLAACDPAISGQGGHRALLWAARGVVYGFDLGPDVGYDLLAANYNPRCVPPWSEAEVRHKVREADTKPFDKPRGWLLAGRDGAEALDGVNLSGLDRQAKAALAPTVVLPSGPADPGPFPVELLQVPGFVGDLVRYTEETAHRSQPALALGAAISLQAVLAGRKVGDEQGTRTNLYAVGIAPSGGGKDHARQINKRVLALAGAEALQAPEELASHAGLITVMELQPAALLQLDEFGRLLRTMGDPTKSPHLYALGTLLLRLYTSSSSLYKAGGYADARRNKQIHQPCAVVYGTSVPQSFYEGLTVEAITDGLMARLLIFEGGTEVPDLREPRPIEVPDAIISSAKAWWALDAGGNLASVNPKPFEVPSSVAARDIFRRLATEADQQRRVLGDTLGCLWTRAVEKARRLALVHACSRAIPPSEVDAAAAVWACDLAAYLTRRMVYLASQWVSDSAFDARRLRVLRHIRNARTNGLSKAELTRKTQSLTQRERDEVLAGLLEGEEITVRVVPGRGRHSLWYHAAEFSSDRWASFTSVTSCSSPGRDGEGVEQDMTEVK